VVLGSSLTVCWASGGIRLVLLGEPSAWVVLDEVLGGGRDNFVGTDDGVRPPTDSPPSEAQRGGGRCRRSVEKGKWVGMGSFVGTDGGVRPPTGSPPSGA
jgi:hypothetical protein